MKIVRINGSYGDADSTGRTTKEMQMWFRENGVESYSYVSCFNDDSKESDFVSLYGSKQQRKVHALQSRIFGKQGFYSKKVTKDLILRLDKIKPDAVIIGVLHNNSLNFPMLFEYLGKSGAIVMIVLHDCFFFTGHCTYFTKYNCMKWIEGCSHCPGMGEDNISWFFDTSAYCWTEKRKWYQMLSKLIVVGVSDWITECAKKSIFNQSANKIERIYNWINLEIFKPSDSMALRIQYNMDTQKKILLGVSSFWTENKGINEIIKTASEISGAITILIGKYDGDKSILPPNIKLIGTVREQRAMADYYCMSDVFLNPSVQETFGKTTAESICCGTPVVAYDTTACTELVGTERGKVVQLKDTDSFVSAVQEVIEKGKNYYRKSLRDFAVNNFDMDTNIRKYYSLIRELYEG